MTDKSQSGLNSQRPPPVSETGRPLDTLPQSSLVYSGPTYQSQSTTGRLQCSGPSPSCTGDVGPDTTRGRRVVLNQTLNVTLTGYWGSSRWSHSSRPTVILRRPTFAEGVVTEGMGREGRREHPNPSGS